MLKQLTNSVNVNVLSKKEAVIKKGSYCPLKIIHRIGSTKEQIYRLGFCGAGAQLQHC